MERVVQWLRSQAWEHRPSRCHPSVRDSTLATPQEQGCCRRFCSYLAVSIIADLIVLVLIVILTSNALRKRNYPVGLVEHGKYAKHDDDGAEDMIL